MSTNCVRRSIYDMLGLPCTFEYTPTSLSKCASSFPDAVLSKPPPIKRFKAMLNPLPSLLKLENIERPLRLSPELSQTCCT
jgi:hypothetical protein